MFTLILSAVLGVMSTKVLDNGNRRKNQFLVYIFLVVFWGMFAVIYDLMGKSQHPPFFYSTISKWFSDFEDNAILQCFLIVIVIAIIYYLNRHEEEVLSFEKYSERIINFTKNARANSIIKIVAGDMDFFGGVKLDGAQILQLMDNSEEYQQLLNLRRSLNGLKIEILCSHGLEREQELFDAIINKTTSSEIIYNKYRNMESLEDSTFQQLLRIGKIKTDFKSSVEIRFYNEKNADKEFRARFIDNEGIVYRKEKEYTRKVFRFKSTFPFIERVTISENLYSINNLNIQEYAYYTDMLSLKWGACDIDSSKKIITFCESLYRYVNHNEPRFHMALVYVNSYEVARKKEKRKEFPPFGVMYLAASVRQDPDWDVNLIAVDEKTTNKDLESWIKYDVIGVSIISSYSYDILKHCYNASKRKLGVVTIAGGYQAEKFSNNVFQDFDADIIFKGEGENSIRDFCKHYEDRNYAAIEGIIYRGIDKNIYSTNGPICVDIDKIPIPARDLIPDEDVVMTDRLAGTELKMVHMLFSRGCKYNCFYCAANQDHRIKEIRYRDKLKIVEELEILKSTYSIQGFSIIDDCFLTDQEKAIEICEYIAEQDLGLKWSLAARVDNINDNILAALNKSGCIEIKFGIETGSNELLKKMNKGVTITEAEEAIRKTKEYGIKVKLFIITGLPFENNTTHNETKRFLEKMHSEKLVDRVSLLRYSPLAGSYIYAQPEQFGVKRNVLTSRNFRRVRLYQNSFDWWADKSRYKDCERWYKEMKKFIDEQWGDK